MSASPITPLEAWICRKIGIGNGARLDRRRLTQYQLEALNRTLVHARGDSPFYRQHLRGLPPEPLSSLDDLAGLPFTTSSDLRRDPRAFLCVSQDRIARAVTLDTTGTTGSPKRLFFTEGDLELTVDFFHHGMSTLVKPGQRALVLLPGSTPGSVGEGMPLIRYRTGDLAAFRVAPCPCGTLLKTLGRVKGRLNGMLTLNPRDTLFIGDLDEAIFSVEGVINYDASMDAECGIDRFTVRVDAQPSSDMVAITDRMRRNVTRLPPVRSAIDDGLLILSIRSMDQHMTVSTGVVKRKFIDLR
jgi:phenylacetate-coenzyme A ligase PaaK-like adenylate-forming protein